MCQCGFRRWLLFPDPLWPFIAECGNSLPPSDCNSVWPVSSSPAHSAALIARLAGGLQARAGEIADVTIKRLRLDLPDYYVVEDPDFQAAGHGALPSVLRAAWTTLFNEGRCPEHLPSHLVDEALSAARSEMPWEVVDRSYAMTHEAIWDAALDEVASWHLPRDDQKLVLRLASKYLFRCFDWLTTAAGQIYAGERLDWLDRRQKRLFEVVSQAIEGLSVSDNELGYRTQQQHVGVIGWGRDPQRAIASAARALGAELLHVPSTGSAIWAWLGRASFPHYADVVAAFAPPPGTYLSVGVVEAGRAGFALTHHQAQLASSVAVRRLVPTPSSVVAYSHVAVEAFALADESRAWMFVRHVLGPLANDDAKSRRLRETLRAYCDADQSTSAAADRLGVVERTVRYRLRELEEALGDRLARGMVELGLAVRLFDALEGQSRARLLAMAASSDNATGGPAPLAYADVAT